MMLLGGLSNVRHHDHTKFYEDIIQLCEFSARAGVGRVGAWRFLPLLLAVAQSARHDAYHDGFFRDAVHRWAAFDSADLFCNWSAGRRSLGLMDFEDTQLMPNQALQRTRHGVVVCNRSVPWAGSLSLGR